MELALQIMGFKWLGKLEDARNVAAMIIGSNNSGTGQDLGGTAPGTSAGGGLESTLLKCLDVIDLDTSPHPARLSQRSKTGHTMLHYASMAGMRRLVAGLLVRGVNPAVKDRSGFTALHYAAWLGRGKVVQRLLSGENTGLLAMKTLEGKTPEDLAVETGRVEMVHLLTATYTDTLSRASSVASVASLGESLSRPSLDDYFAGSEWDESQYGGQEAAEEDEDDGTLWLGSLRGTNSSPSEPSTPSLGSQKRRFMPQLPDAQTLNPALYVTALNDLLQPYLRTLRLAPHDAKLPTALHLDTRCSNKKYDLPPPAYSELFPVRMKTKSQFSLATRLSLRGRSFLRWTGMAGDAGLSAEEIEYLRKEDCTRKKTWTRDYMLLFFWVPIPLPASGFEQD